MEIARLNAEMDQIYPTYMNKETQISNESVVAKQVKSYRVRIVEKEIELIEETLRFANRFNGLLARVKDSLIGNPKRQNQIQSEMDKVRRAKESAETALELKQRTLNIEKERNY